jgi:hypothetical protein
MTDVHREPTKLQNRFSEEKIKHAFQEFSGGSHNANRDHSTSLDVTSITQLQDFAFALGDIWDEETCLSIIAILDVNKSGSIEIDSFARWMATDAANHLQSREHNVFIKASWGVQLLLRAAHRRASLIVQRISNAGDPNVPRGTLTDVAHSTAEESKRNRACPSELDISNSLHTGIPMSQTRVRM